MFYTFTGVLIRIFSNSYLNVCQKILTGMGQRPSVVNFYTYLGLTVLVLPIIPYCTFNTEIALNFLIMGLLGALGNYFIIKALSIGELSTLAPINSYKPVVALIAGMIYLKEIPSLQAVFAIGLIIAGTFFIIDRTSADFNAKALFYRVLALISSASEAVFIKKIIILTNISTAFVLWVLAGALFSFIFVLHARSNMNLRSWKYQILLIISVGIMQYSTNYVFARMNVSYALALFQLSTLLSVVLGANVFHEKNLRRKLIGACVMLLGAVVLILR